MSFQSATGTFPITGNNITISGLAFQPAIVFFWTVGGANGSGGTFGAPITSDGVAPAPAVNAFGCYDGTNQWCCSSAAANNNGGSGDNGSYSGCQSNASGGTGYVIIGPNYSNSNFDSGATYAAVAMNSDGFTLHPISQTGGPGYGEFQVHYLALGGSAVVNATAGSIILTSGSTSNQSVTGLGFTPNCLIGASVGRSTGNAGNPSFLSADWALSVGVCDASLNQGVVANWATFEGSNVRTSYYNQHGQFYAVSSNADTSATNLLTNYGKIASLQSGGFTVTPQAAASSDITLCYAAINITDAFVGNFVTQTNTSNFSQTGLGFVPGAVLFLSSCQPESTPNLTAFAAVAFDNTAGGAITSVTYGGQAMTSCGTAADNSSNNAFCQLFYLANPPTGSNALVVTGNAQVNEIYANVVSFSGVNQTTPVRSGSYQTNTSAAGTATLTISSNANDLTLSVINGGATSLTSGDFSTNSGTAFDGDNNAGTFCGASGHSTTGASSVTHSWTSAAAFAIAGLSVMAAGSSPVQFNGTNTMAHAAASSLTGSFAVPAPLQPTGPMAIGCTTGAASQNVAAVVSKDNVNPSVVAGGEYFDSVYLNLAAATASTNPTVQGVMALESLDSDGFTTKMSVADVQANKVFYLAFGPGAPPPPTVTSCTPDTGYSTGGTIITNLAGTGFVATPTVLFDSTPATSVVFVSSTQLTCVTPANAVGAATITVTNPDTSTSGPVSGLFTYVAPPPPKGGGSGFDLKFNFGSRSKFIH
jgi:hypothetical protein